MGSGVAAEAGGWDANNSGVNMEGLRSLGNAKRCAVEVKAKWSNGAREAVEPKRSARGRKDER